MRPLQLNLATCRSFFLVIAMLGGTLGCTKKERSKAATLYKTHCASCHTLPDINNLPKALWKNEVLPEMAARMGIKEGSYNPLKNLSFDEQYAVLASGIYPKKGTLSDEDWKLLRDYIIDLAPDSLLAHRHNTIVSSPLPGFNVKSVSVDSLPGSFISFLKFDEKDKKVKIGDMAGRVFEYDHDNQNSLLERIAPTRKKITAFEQLSTGSMVLTDVGKFDPSEIVGGSIWMGTGKDDLKALPMSFHRPVHTLVHDFNGDSIPELVVSEFGHLSGKLTLLKSVNGNYGKQLLLGLPGSIKTVARDMNADGRDDIVALTSQGNEGIFILYQSQDLKFRAEQVLHFDPIYGSSWFELLDYDSDGDYDIITVNGDNADKTKILKPYHGLRIFLNNGSNKFEEAFFYPFHGATRSVSRDFDQDGDIDIALISTFPDYGIEPEQSFRYLENTNSERFEFIPYALPEEAKGRWFLMDAGDVDNDGDEDIVISNFTYYFVSVPNDLAKKWKDSDQDILILENTYTAK